MFGWTGGEWQSVTQNVTEYDTANEWDYNILVLSLSFCIYNLGHNIEKMTQNEKWMYMIIMIIIIIIIRL